MLNTKKIIYSSIIYQITKECNAKCRMCCESSSLNRSGKLDLNIILNSIDSIKDLKNIIYIGVTGGEPFLYIDDVFSISEHCKKLNRQFTVTTNAFWCKTHSYTYNTLKQLKNNNLTICFVSTDAFHEEYVPIEYVKMFLRVCHDLRIAVKIQTSSTKSTFKRTEEIVNSLDDDKLYAEILFAATYPVGMAKNNISPEDFYTRKLENAVCPYYHLLLVTSSGAVQPCCSPSCVGIPFDFGNINNDSIKDIIKRINENELMRILINEGFNRLINEAKRKLQFVELDEYVDTCHLCNQLLSNRDRFIYLNEKARDWLQKEKAIISEIVW